MTRLFLAMIALGWLESSLVGQFEIQVNPEKRGVAYDIQLPPLHVGKNEIVSVMLENDTNVPLEFLGVEKSCTCTTVRVPKTTLQPGEREEAEFEFDVDAYPKELSHHSNVTILTRGPCQRFHIFFKGSLEDHVSFREPTYLANFSDRDKSIEFEIPLLVSGAELIKGTQVIGPKGIETKLMDRGGVCSLRCKSEVRDEMVSTLILKRHGKEVSTCAVSIVRKSAMEILPNPLVFTAGFSPDYVRSATGILRIRNGSPELAKVDNIRCKTKEGAVLPVSFKEMRPGAYRLSIQVVDWEDLPANTELTFEVSSVDGQNEFKAKATVAN